MLGTSREKGAHIPGRPLKRGKISRISCIFSHGARNFKMHATAAEYRTDPERTRRERQGLFVLALAAFFFSLFALAGKAVSPAVTAPQMVLIRSGFMVPILAVWALRRGDPLLGVRPSLLLLRGVLGSLGLFTFFFALKRLPLADTVLIFQAHPLLVAALAPWFLGERNRGVHWMLLSASFLGVALVVGPTGAGSWPGRISALACCVVASFVYLLVRYLRRSEATLTIAFSFPAASFLLFGAAFLLRLPGCAWHAPTPRDWVFLSVMALCAAGGQVLLTFGLGRVPAARGTAVSNLQVFFALLYGALFFDEIPAWSTVAGAAVIVGAQVLLAFTRKPPEGRGAGRSGRAAAGTGPE